MPSTSELRGITGTGATDALGQAITAFMHGMATCSIILGMTAITLTVTTCTATGKIFSGRSARSRGINLDCSVQSKA